MYSMRSFLIHTRIIIIMTNNCTIYTNNGIENVIQKTQWVSNLQTEITISIISKGLIRTCGNVLVMDEMWLKPHLTPISGMEIGLCL